MARTKYYIKLDEAERDLLTRIICEEKESARTIMRAKILLMSEEAQAKKISIRELAENLKTTEVTIKTVRAEYVESGLDAALYRKKREVSRQTRKINDEVIEKIKELMKSAPPEGHYRWSSRMLCEAAVENGIVDHIGLTAMCEIMKANKE